MGARVVPVDSGQRTLKDAINEAMRDWMGSVEHTHYIIGSVAGPAPVPDDGPRVPKLHRPRGAAADARRPRAGCPTCIVACVGGGSNAAGMFAPMIDDAQVEMVGVEAGGRGMKPRRARRHALPGRARRAARHADSYVLQDDDGQTAHVHSVSAGLDYPGVGPEHAYWKDTGRVQYTVRQRRRGHRRRGDAVAGPRASSPPWNRPTPWPRR